MHARAAHAREVEVKALRARRLEGRGHKLNLQVLRVQRGKRARPVFVKVAGSRAGAHVRLRECSRR